MRASLSHNNDSFLDLCQDCSSGCAGVKDGKPICTCSFGYELAPDALTCIGIHKAILYNHFVALAAVFCQLRLKFRPTLFLLDRLQLELVILINKIIYPGSCCCNFFFRTSVIVCH